MPFNEKIAARIREAIAGAGKVTEKTLFRGMCFMLEDKMCICVNDNEILCRIGEAAAQTALEKPGCRQMVNNGRTMKDYVFVSTGVITSNKEFNYWINASLAFNKTAKAAPKKASATPKAAKTAAAKKKK